MTPQEKDSELQRYRSILLATLDYLQEHLGGSFVLDQYDLVTEYYQQQKIQTEKYFRLRRLDRLQQRFQSLTKRLQNRVHIAFPKYIKENTGYDIDIYEELHKRVNSILVRGEIRNKKELNDISTMLHFYYETSADRAQVEKLQALYTNYFEHNHATSRNRKSEYTEVVSSIEKDGMVITEISSWSGPKPKHFEEQEAVSPDGNRKLRVVQWSDGKHASTYVTVEFKTASGAVYGISGICPDIKAWWKDNATIVIETSKEYTANTQHQQVRSFDDIISIEYRDVNKKE